MRIRIIGGGWYGCHIAKTLNDIGHTVELHEVKDDIFTGASGANPARLHLGFHYPRSYETREMCQKNYKRFMEVYGKYTRGIQTNIYAVAALDSMVDYKNFIQVLRDEVEFIQIYNPKEFGLRNVEGAVLTGERHILVNKIRDYFKRELKHVIKYNKEVDLEDHSFDLTIDCTFCSLDSDHIDRYEPCATHIYEGDYNKAVTIMDGPFPSIYPHYEPGTVSLTSALYTPLSKRCKTYEEAKKVLEEFSFSKRMEHAGTSLDLMAYYYPNVKNYRYIRSDLAIRAMPRSGADSRIWRLDKRTSDYWVVRAGKIDAIFNVSDLLEHEIQKSFAATNIVRLL